MDEIKNEMPVKMLAFFNVEPSAKPIPPNEITRDSRPKKVIKLMDSPAKVDFQQMRCLACMFVSRTIDTPLRFDDHFDDQFYE